MEDTYEVLFRKRWELNKQVFELCEKIVKEGYHDFWLEDNLRELAKMLATYDEDEQELFKAQSKHYHDQAKELLRYVKKNE